MTHRLKIATWNLGLLSVGIESLNLRFAEPVPYVDLRRAAVIHSLLEFDADVVAVQEAYGVRQRRMIREAVRGRFPHAGLAPGRVTPGLDSGLMILSRFPVLGMNYVSYEARLPEECLIADRGILWITIGIPDGRELTVATTHAVAGGPFLHPEDARMNAVRHRQIGELLRVFPGDHELELNVLAGDFNTGPGVSQENYYQLVSGGYADAFAVTPDLASRNITWDPMNTLNEKGTHRSCPPQRIDHVFYPNRNGCGAKSTKILCRDAVVQTPTGLVTPSDHYALVADLCLE